VADVQKAGAAGSAGLVAVAEGAAAHVAAEADLVVAVADAAAHAVAVEIVAAEAKN
jgi:hypothetical protein